MSDRGEEFEYLEEVEAHLRLLYADVPGSHAETQRIMGYMAAEVITLRRLLASVAPEALAAMHPAAWERKRRVRPMNEGRCTYCGHASGHAARCRGQRPSADTLARAVVDRAYLWRYAILHGADIETAESALVEAVDAWDTERVTPRPGRSDR